VPTTPLPKATKKELQAAPALYRQTPLLSPRLLRAPARKSAAAAGLPIATPWKPIIVTLPSHETTIGKFLFRPGRTTGRSGMGISSSTRMASRIVSQGEETRAPAGEPAAAAGLPIATPWKPIIVTLPSHETTIGKFLTHSETFRDGVLLVNKDGFRIGSQGEEGEVSHLLKTSAWDS